MYFQQFQTFQLSVYIETDNQKDENKCSMKYFLSIQNSGNMDLRNFGRAFVWERRARTWKSLKKKLQN